MRYRELSTVLLIALLALPRSTAAQPDGDSVVASFESCYEAETGHALSDADRELLESLGTSLAELLGCDHGACPLLESEEACDALAGSLEQQLGLEGGGGMIEVPTWAEALSEALGIWLDRCAVELGGDVPPAAMLAPSLASSVSMDCEPAEDAVARCSMALRNAACESEIDPALVDLPELRSLTLSLPNLDVLCPGLRECEASE